MRCWLFVSQMVLCCFWFTAITASAQQASLSSILPHVQENVNSTIWIDRETMQVVRLLTDPIEISISLIGKMLIRGNYFNIQRYDYAPILVGKEHWWLPVAGRNQIKRDEQLMLEQEREFRNYRMFASSVKINYESLSK